MGVYEPKAGCTQSQLAPNVTVQSGYGVVRRERQDAKGLRPLMVQVPKMVAREPLVWLPSGERVPPLILRLITTGRIARSAALLAEGTRGSATNTNSSGRKRSIRSHRTG